VLGADGGGSSRRPGFLRYLHRIERSRTRSVLTAHDLRLFFQFLDGRGLVWDAVAVADLGDFAGGLRRPAVNVLLLLARSRRVLRDDPIGRCRR